MMSYQAAEVVLVSFPFADTHQSKKRPALVLVDSGDADVLVARVTTQAYQDAYDLELLDWQGAGLLAPSTARIHKLATLTKSLVSRCLGMLTPADRQRVANLLSQVFSNW